MQEKDWSTIVCIASGPSLTDDQLSAIEESGHPTIVVNRSFEKAPWADIVYACDYGWWKVYYKDVEPLFDTHTELWTREGVVRSVAKTHPSASDKMDEIPCVHGEGLGKDGIIHHGGNSGYQAINLAYLMGAEKIILVGYDHQHTDGKRHHHEDYEKKKFRVNADHTEIWLNNIKRLCEDLHTEGVDIVNCTISSAIECCRRSTLGEEL